MSMLLIDDNFISDDLHSDSSRPETPSSGNVKLRVTENATHVTMYGYSRWVDLV
jgi:hypothetical protein